MNLLIPIKNKYPELGNLGDKVVVPELENLLKHDNGNVIISAAEALGNLGAKEAIPALENLLDHENGYVVLFVAEALGKILPKN